MTLSVSEGSESEHELLLEFGDAINSDENETKESEIGDEDELPVGDCLGDLPVKCCKLECCTDRVRSRTDNKDEVLEGKFRNINFSPFTKMTTENSFELFLSIYRYLIFFPKF